MASILSSKKKLPEGDRYDELNDAHDFSPSILSEVLDAITGLGRMKVCDDNPESPISDPTGYMAARMGLSNNDLLESAASKDNKMLEPIRVEVNTQGRDKIKIGFGDEYGEIFSVRVVDLGGKSHCKIHGEIVLRASLGKTCLFRRKKKDPLTIACGDIIPLTGPIVATFPYEGFAVDIHLKEGDNDLCDGWLRVLSDYTKVQNPQQIEALTWSRGCVALTYSIFYDAILAEVEVKLLKNKTTTKI